jgi:prepilin-type N-terminal cleavage/methylation domain-containing protein
MNSPMTARSVASSAGTFFGVNAQENSENDDSELTGDDGFTLAEVIVSIALFTIMSVAVISALVTLVKLTAVTQNRVAASNLARQEIEKLRGQNGTVSQLDSAALSVALKGTTYTVTPIMSPAATASCAPGAARNVTVKVSWNDSGSRSVRYDTVLSC